MYLAGQPFEVIKTAQAAERSDTLVTSIRKIYARGGLFGFYQGLWPWALIEASTKGAVLLFAASELEYLARSTFGLSSGPAGILAGMGGGIAQAYTTLGFCTFMKTVEITRHKDPSGNVSTVQIAKDIFKREGIRGINKGVNAVALRQCTNWGSRLGLSRFTEQAIRRTQSEEDKKKPLSALQKVLASTVGGALSCWNQPIEVIRVEMQSQIKQAGRPEKMTIVQCAKWIYEKNGLRGFYRGVIPRVGLGAWQTICMVAGGDQLKAKVAAMQKQKSY
jgi:hypothetical protein